MRISTPILIVVLSLFYITHFFGEVYAMGFDVMPVPAKITAGEGKFRLSDSFKVAAKGDADDRLYRGVTRTLRRLSKRTGLFFPQGIVTSRAEIDTANFLIACKRPGRIVNGEDESYSLVVTEQEVKLNAETDIGILRGLETVLQLVTGDSLGYYLPSVIIEDEPRFPWRGLLIDAGRHFMPIDVLKRNLDGMAAVKMNVFHWHLTEDQGFRAECKTFPKLQELGSDGFYYTHEQIKEIIQYAADRGIRVLPEFDIPGHTTSWFVGYPELASAPGPYQISRKWGIHDAVMDPTKEETYQFLDKFFQEMAALFPDEYLHIGGDENNGKHWSANPDIQNFMKQQYIPDNHALQSYFNRRVQKILAKYNKKMVGWDEIFHPDLPKDIVIHSWRGKKSLCEAAQQGYPGILSNDYYIDLIQPTDFHYLNDPIPPDAQLTERERKLIFGGEATMWSEFVCAETVDSRIWPRTAAIAERLWSPGSVTDVDDMYRRLEIVSLRLEEVGLTHEKNYEMMLRRLVNDDEVAALKNFVDVIEPVKIYTRAQQREYTQFSPLTRVVDAAKPDTPVAREFRKSVERYLKASSKNPTTLEELQERLKMWKNNHDLLQKTIKKSPVLKEIETLSADLAATADIGLESFNYLQKCAAPDSNWVKEKLEFLNKAKAPRGQTELMIISAVEQLVKKAANY
ncbi:MAG TPA: family 20 glycosylhydrolase [bacterium]